MQKRGFTLVELILVIVVISVGLIAVIEGITRSMQLLRKTSNEVIAINLAREGMEAVYAIRNTNRLRRSGQRDSHRLRSDPMDATSPWMGIGGYNIIQNSGRRSLSPITTLERSIGSQEFPATSCNQIKMTKSDAVDGVYWLQSGGMTAPKQYYCDMTTNGGGWQLLFQRSGGTNNRETCAGVQKNILNDFLHDGACGDVNNLGYGDSYNSDDVSVTIADFAPVEYMNVQYNASMVPDVDDAFIIHTTTPLFPNSSSPAETIDIAVDKICDINNANCDTTDGYWKYIGNSWFHSALCRAGNAANNTNYGGNYGYCHNGWVGAVNSLFGDRSAYFEAKLWKHSYGSSYMERFFVRGAGEGVVNGAGGGISLCFKNGSYVADSDCPPEQQTNFYRTIVGKGLYNKRTGVKIVCDGTETTGECVDDTPKEYRFCSVVTNTTGLKNKVEMCGVITNFMK